MIKNFMWCFVVSLLISLSWNCIIGCVDEETITPDDGNTFFNAYTPSETPSPPPPTPTATSMFDPTGMSAPDSND